ncbi:MAG: ATP-binding cassette domain-containing protein [Bacteroidales bacterium]|nr:ATP-binding cassette domain-containing protein [Bacteroidales bacterium]
MNDIILSGLLNLFALFAAENKLDKEQGNSLIKDYLTRFYGIRNSKSYMRLFSDLRDYYEDFPELDRISITEKVCSNIAPKTRTEEKNGIILRLMEFCSLNNTDFNPNDAILLKAASEFNTGKGLFEDMIRFVEGKEGGRVRIIGLDGNAGQLKTLFLKESGKLYFTYIGSHSIWLDDIRITSGIFQTLERSSVLKSSHFSPIYYSTIVGGYENEIKPDAVELCGRDINFRFDTGGDNGMHNLSFTLKSGELVAIMGGSGVGKSTLLSLLNGNLIPQSGSITINGHDISEPSAKALIGFVPQDDLLIEELTVYQNLWYTAKLCFDKMPDSEIDRKVMSVLVQLGLDAAKDLKVGSAINKYISGGQRKRLNIALELIREPAILFLDEPTSGLSSSDTENVINLLKEQTYKGKLIVANIHQPSSDVYKLFTRLWLLDKGGYPIYDGNPIEAISYFKSAANYADSRSSSCPTCGNVNPEIVLNIIDEKAIDNEGQLSDKRKTSPAEWHELYLEKRAEMPDPDTKDVPSTEQRRPDIFKQTAIFLRRNAVAKLTNLQYVLVTLLEAPVLAAICAFLTRYTPDSGVYSILENKNLVSYFFMAIIVAIFLGMSGSAEEIIKDRALLKREKFLQLSHSSYISSKIIYMGAVCLVQTLLFLIVGNLIMGIHGLFWIWWLILFVSAFLSALIGLLLSQCMNSVVAIYITIPLLLIPQILLCGLVVKFDDLNHSSETGNVPLIGEIIPSRWAYEALAVANFSKNDYEKMFFEYDRDRFSCMFYTEGFIYELESQLEQREDERRDSSKEEKAMHMDVLRTELPFLARICGMPEYDGDESYESLSEYFSEAKAILKKRSNASTLAMDKAARDFIAENGKEALTELKNSNFNLSLEDLVVNRDTDYLCVVRGSHIVPKSGYVFLTPRSRNGRAPFYSGVKVIGNKEIETVWYDLAVLLLMCVIVGTLLYTDFPGKLVREERN